MNKLYLTILTIGLFVSTAKAQGPQGVQSQKEVIITGDDVPKFLPAGSDVEITVKIDSSRRIDFEAYFPFLEESIELTDILDFDPKLLSSCKRSIFSSTTFIFFSSFFFSPSSKSILLFSSSDAL